MRQRRSGRRVLPMALGLAVWMAGSASAQGLYYKEILREGRIYVFNDAERAERFEKSGEMGRSLTRVGAGPKGETVVADSERALQLFFFKYGISEVVPEPPPAAPPARPWRISGYMFGDYYYFAESHDEMWKEQQGLWFRRIYLTYDHRLSPRFATRLRLEMNSSGELTSSSLTPYVKDAYLSWTYHGRQEMVFGIQPTPTFEFIETVWGLRHIEKTPADLYRTDSSRDFGVSLAGPLNESRTFHYNLQFGNESSTHSEVDESKAVRVSARFETNPGFVAEGFFGFFDRPDGSGDRQMGQGFVGYVHKKGRAAFQYYRQVRRAASGIERARPQSGCLLRIRRARRQAGEVEHLRSGGSLPGSQSGRRRHRLPAARDQRGVHTGARRDRVLPAAFHPPEPQRRMGDLRQSAERRQAR